MLRLITRPALGRVGHPTTTSLIVPTPSSTTRRHNSSFSSRAEQQLQSLRQSLNKTASQASEASRYVIPERVVGGAGHHHQAWMKNLGLNLALTAHKGMLWGGGLAIAIGTILYMFKEPLKADAVGQTAEVTTRVISEKKVKDEALELSKGVVRNILRDDASVDLLVDLLKKLVSQKETQSTLKELLRQLYADEYTRENTKKFVVAILNDDWVKDNVVELARRGLYDLMKDEELKQSAAQYLKEVVKMTVQDNDVQQETGDALYNALKLGLGLKTRTKTEAAPRAQPQDVLQTR